MPETPVIAALIMDRSDPLGNSEGVDTRRALHTKIRNSNSEPIPIAAVPIPQTYDAITVAYPNSTTETYTYKTGGTGGTTILTVTVVYTSSSKQNLSQVTWT